MKYIFKQVSSFLLLLLITLTSGCVKDVVTRRPVYNEYSIEAEIQLGKTALLGELYMAAYNNWAINPKKYDEQLRQIQEIVRRIGSVSDFPFFPYEVYLVDSPTVNAMCLPGGKLIVYTGLWNPYDGLVELGNDDQMAAVIAHEIAHANARHATEKLSSQHLFLSIGQGIAGVIAQAGYGDWAQFFYNLWGGLYPQYTPKNEFEADKIGLKYMARAGYNPAEAVAIWKKAATKHVNDPSNYSFSHPSDASRALALEPILPEALAIYEASPHRATASRTSKTPEPIEYPTIENPFLQQFTAGRYTIKNDRCQSGGGEFVVAPAESYKEIAIKYFKSRSKDFTTKSDRKLYDAAYKKLVSDFRADKSMGDEYYFYKPDEPLKAYFAKVNSDGEVNISDNKYGPSFVCGGIFRKGNKYREARFYCAPLVPTKVRCTFTLVHMVDEPS
jgi:Zn-dependent protease with chaperone function